MAEKNKAVKDINPVNEKFIPRLPSKDSSKWKEPIEILISTREELFKFAYDNELYPEDDIRSYMPVNSFTAPEALFSEDEYMTDEAQAVIRRLEEKQVYSFDKYLKLLKSIKENEIFTAIDAVDTFYSWGITGLNSVICSKNKVELNMPLSENNSVKGSILRKDFTFINKNMELIKPLPAGWHFINKKEEIKLKTEELQDERTWCILPIETSVSEEGIEYLFPKLKVVISSSSYLASFGGFEALHNTIRVLSPNITALPNKYWGIDNPEIRKNLLKYTQIQSIVDYIIDLITVKSNASSYYMYRALSLSPRVAVETVLYKQRDVLLTENLTETPETIKYIEENGPEAAEDINALKFFITDVDTVFSIPDEDMETNASLVGLRDKVMDGEINLDAILDGGRIDAITRDNGLIDFITVAVEKLGYTYKELIEEASKINPTPDIPYEFILEKNSIRISFDLYLRNSKLEGYKNDITNNQNEFADKAAHWCIVTDIYEEPGEKFARHVAVRLKTWPHYLNKKRGSYIKDIENKIHNALLNCYEEKDSLSYDTAQIIYKIYNSEYITEDENIKISIMAGPLRRKTDIILKSSIINEILTSLEDKFEGILQISDNIMINGNPVFFIINAIITPYWVCPLFKKEIEVSSLYLAWKYGTDNKDQSSYEKCISNNWLSNKRRNSINTALDPLTREISRLTIGVDEDWDIREYCYNMLATDKEGKLLYPEPFKHP